LARSLVGKYGILSFLNDARRPKANSAQSSRSSLGEDTTKSAANSYNDGNQSPVD